MSEYLSTRGCPEVVGLERAIMDGYAPDQGLYVPADGYPHVSLPELEELQGQPYETVYKNITGRFIGDTIPEEVQDDVIGDSYSAKNFPHIEDGNVAPVYEAADGIYVQELSLGPTASFKDMALLPLLGHINHIVEKNGLHIVIGGVSSGDTVSAAENAAKGKSNLDMLMITPQTGMSEFQEAQTAHLSGGNIHNLSVNGDFDKGLELMTEANKQFDLGAVNSINWGRIISQIPYYFSGYLQTIEKAGLPVGSPIDISVPTGNVGNLFSAHVARSMGLPIRQIFAANNENDSMNRFINTGVYDPRKSIVTSSPSADITRPKNLERLLYDIFGGDEEKVTSFFTASATGAVALSDYCEVGNLTELGFGGSSSTHSDRLATIKHIYEATDRGIFIDPHTADGVFAALNNKTADVPMLVMSTALPVKFEGTVREAVGSVPEREERFRGLEESQPSNAFTPIDNLGELLDYISANTEAKEKIHG